MQDPVNIAVVGGELGLGYSGLVHPAYGKLTNPQYLLVNVVKVTYVEGYKDSVGEFLH